MLSLDVCTAAVTSATDNDGALQSTGRDGLLAILIVGAILVIGGVAVLLFRSHTRGRASAGFTITLAAVIFAGGAALGGTGSASPAGAATPESCELISIGDITRGGGSSGAGTLPGDTAVALEFTIRNSTGFPIDVTVDTVVTDDTADAAPLYSTELLDPADHLLSAGPLDDVPSTGAIEVPAGASLGVRYSLTLDPAATNAIQGASVVFDSIVSVTSD